MELPELPPAWLDYIKDSYGFGPPWPPEFGVYFERHFKCDCGAVWIDVHDCDCNDRCPRCNREIEPRETLERDALTGSYIESG